MNSDLAGNVAMCKTDSSVAGSSSSSRVKTKSPAASRSSNSQDEGRLERPPFPQSTENVVVAVNASKEITKHALEWALTNIVQPGDQITFVALFQGARNGMKLWGLPMFPGDCANGSTKCPKSGDPREVEEEVTDSCSQMMKQLHKLCDLKKVKVSVKVIQASGRGTTALEAQRVRATWVVLDSQLKKEEKCCMEQLNCNLVIVKRFSPKILRLNLRAPSENEREPPEETTSTQGSEESAQQEGSCENGKATTCPSEEGASTSSPEVGTPFTATEQGTSCTSSSEPGTSPLMSSEVLPVPDSGQNSTDTPPPVRHAPEDGSGSFYETDSATDFGLADARSETSSDESGVLYRNSPSSPERRSSSNSAVKHFQPSDFVPQPWLDYSLIDAQTESFSMEPWKPLAKTRPNSANATPISDLNQGRSSTPVSPLSPPMRFAGNARLSFSMREGGSGRNKGAGTNQVNSPFPGLKNSISSHRPRHPDLSNLKSSVQSFELDKGIWSKRRVVTTKELLEKFAQWDHELGIDAGGNGPYLEELERSSSVRKAMSLSRHVPSGPPPLCSICQHKAPVFGKPPRRFTYADLELATGGFSQANFLAEGGFGSVHRGVLPDGQAVAVKQHKLASSQGDIEFCSEVEVLSCAQHRNVVMLIGYCIEDKRRLLVYEFICNGSLDSHLYGRDKDCLEWPARQKIALGAARGLRYLHEECRVGCIVHRDMRPNNILLTHDFEPMVGDFGLARWQPDGDLGVQTRVIGTFGYLAPEYAQSGQITEKADVYSFGVVLLELATGRKAVDLNRPKGQQCLTEWARPLLDEHVTQHLIDPLLNSRYSDYEVYCMLHAASLCIRKDPHLRPRMSQVLRILEGDIVIDTSGPSTPCYSSRLAYDTAMYGSRSSRISSEYFVNRLAALSPPLISYSGSLGPDFLTRRLAKLSAFGEPLSNCHGNLSYETLKAAYKDRGNILRLSYEDMI